MKIPKDIQPLIDGDWIVYMACNAIEYRLMKEWREAGEVEPEPTPSFDDTVRVLVSRVKEVSKVLGTEMPPLFLFTGKNNFRKEVAKTKVYKGNRKGREKPFHYQNLVNYIEASYATSTIDNVEADDLMAILQTEATSYPTCIVTVDKDLRQVNGWHYSPEGANFPSFGPTYVTDDNSYIKWKDPENKKKGLIGTGYKFFYAQLITGDGVDNIPGLPKGGPTLAMQLLEECTTERECFEVVRWEYRGICWDPDTYMKEQIDLLWMIRHFNDDGSIQYWEEPDEK